MWPSGHVMWPSGHVMWLSGHVMWPTYLVSLGLLECAEVKEHWSFFLTVNTVLLNQLFVKF